MTALSMQVRQAASGLRTKRRENLEKLNRLFREGHPPKTTLEGRYRGEFLGLSLGALPDVILGAIARAYMPWKGKRFDPATGSGDNLFDNSARLLTRLYFPFYRGIHAEAATTFRAFAFRTCTAPGLFDPDRTVLKIDYDRPDNPAPIRRVLDELVQLEPGYYLGKAHFNWWLGGWGTVAYFALSLSES